MSDKALVDAIRRLIGECGEDRFQAATREATKRDPGRHRDVRPDDLDALLYLAIDINRSIGCIRRSVNATCKCLVREWDALQRKAFRELGRTAEQWNETQRFYAVRTGLKASSLRRRYNDVQRKVVGGELVVELRAPDPDPELGPIPKRLSMLLLMALKFRVACRSVPEIAEELHRLVNEIIVRYARVERT
jgi:hypothetical protein